MVMKGSIVGFGTIAMGHLAAYIGIEDIVIEAVADPLPMRRQQAKKMVPSIRTYESLEELLSEEDVDFIDICSPPISHFDYIRTGLLNRKHVLCEKPLLLCADQYKEILSLLSPGKSILYPSHNYKFAPILRSMKATVQSEDFGQIIRGHFRTLRSGHALGVPEWNPHWRRAITISGGGILWDHGPHSVYIACEMSGRFPTAVSCILGSLKADNYQDTEDTAMLTVHFGNDFQIAIDLSWAASFRDTYYSIIGSKESVIVENDECIHTKQSGEIARIRALSAFDDSSHKMWFRDMFLDFASTATEPDRQLPLLRDAYITCLVIEAAYVSARDGGRLVGIPPLSETILRN